MNKERSLVVVVHGLGRSRLSMAKLTTRLEKNGFEVLNWGYNSLTGGIHEFGQRLAEQLKNHRNHHLIHGVGHSLGGLILRHAFSVNPQQGQRLVTLGTPHQGARLIARHGWLFGHKLIPQIITEMHPSSRIIKDLPIPPIEIGAIAGVQQFHPLNPISWLNCLADEGIPHDGTVDIESAKIKGCADYREVYANHSFLPSNEAVIEHTVHFLDTGIFTPQRKLP